MARVFYFLDGEGAENSAPLAYLFSSFFMLRCLDERKNLVLGTN